MTKNDWANLYNTDETGWIESTIGLILQGKFDNIDTVHLSEFMLDHADRNRRTARRELIRLITWVLISDGEPSKNRQPQVTLLIGVVTNMTDDPAIRNDLIENLQEYYLNAVRHACTLMNRTPFAFSATCPWTWDELLTPLPDVARQTQ